MLASDHLTEIGELLAAALQRLLARQSSGEFAPTGESSLHISPDQSGAVAEMANGEKA